MAATKSKSRKGKDTQHEEANAVSTQEASLASSTKEKQMADTPSIISFSEDVATAEAPPPLPVGQYSAEIRSAERKTSATSGNEYVRVQFYIPPEQYPADFTDGNPEGMILDYNRVPVQDNPSARFRMRKFCEAIGYSPKGGNVDINEWIGNTATVDIVHDTFEGETRAQIKRVVAP
ncbi:MAG TPA: DUF669 domain-containing protein [Candidatus Saccharimonadales bacterium]|nr:DUF669 domain-containing protein [Candidatus Saccharimonadales bacterium]